MLYNNGVLRQADNLFLLRLPFEDDVRHVAKSAKTDYETLSSFVRRLPDYHALAIGEVTRGYPLIFRVDSLRGVNTAGETKLLFGDRFKPGFRTFKRLARRRVLCSIRRYRWNHQPVQRLS